jgi:tetratricopeptide (TPR) repeat protein
MMAGVTDFNAGERKAARAKLEEALDLDHECVDARLWLAHLLIEEGEGEAALQQYQTGLLFSPQDPRLLQGLQQGQSAAHLATTPEGKDAVAAKQRLIPNLILAVLIPPSGFLLGIWEIATGRTQEWKDLGVKTLLAAVAGAVAWILLLAFIGIVVGGDAGP